MFTKYKDVLTVKEAAEALNVGRGLVYRQIKEGKLQAVKVGSCLRIPKSSLRALLKASPPNN